MFVNSPVCKGCLNLDTMKAVCEFGSFTFIRESEGNEVLVCTSFIAKEVSVKDTCSNHVGNECVGGFMKCVDCGEIGKYVASLDKEFCVGRLLELLNCVLHETSIAVARYIFEREKERVSK